MSKKHKAMKKATQTGSQMADRETTSFPKVGDHPPGTFVADVSGERSPYMQYGVKRGYGKDDAAADPADKGNRTAVLQPAELSGAAYKIRTAIAGGQPDMPRASYTVRGPFRRNANGPVVVEDR